MFLQCRVGDRDVSSLVDMIDVGEEWRSWRVGRGSVDTDRDLMADVIDEALGQAAGLRVVTPAFDDSAHCLVGSLDHGILQRPEGMADR